MMKLIKMSFVLLAMLMTMPAMASEISVIPQPTKMTLGKGAFAIQKDTTIRVANELTKPIGELLAKQLAPATGWTLKVEVGTPADGAINIAATKPAATKPATVHAKMVDGTLVLFPTNPKSAIVVRYQIPGLDAWVSATRTGGKTHQVRIYSRVRKKATITFRYPFGEQSATWSRPVTRKGDLVSVTLGWHQMFIGELMDVNEGADAADKARKKLGTTGKADANLPIVYYSGDSISLGNWPWVEAALWGKANLYYQREVWEHIPAARSKNNGHAHMAYASLLKAYKDENFKPDYLMVNFGLHMVNPYTKRKEQYGPWVQKFVDLAKAKGAKLIWVTTTPYALKSKAKNLIIENFNAQAIAIAKKHAIPVIDLYTFIQAQVKAKGEKEVYPPDGVHFTEPTKKAMGKFMAKRIREILKIPAKAPKPK